MFEKIINSPVKRFQDDKTLKWNLQRKDDGTFVSDVWFDNLGTSGGWSLKDGETRYWDGLVFLEPPVKTIQGCYPFWVKAKIYQFTSKGEFMTVHKEISCGIWHNNSEKIDFIS